MKIIIVGSGKVGYSLAEILSKEDNDITLIDSDANKLKKPSDNLDILCIEGSGASTKILKRAGISEADVLLAVTNKDETNMICSLIARKMGVKHTVARIRDPEYLEDLDELKADFGLDMIINPEQAVAYEIARYLEASTASTVDLFEQGNMEVVEIKVTKDMSIVDKAFMNINKKNKYASLFRIIYRDNNIIIPKDSTRIQENDLIYVIGWYHRMLGYYTQIGVSTKRADNIMILGGGRITFYFCKLLALIDSNIKVIEINSENARYLAENIDNVLVIQGDGSDYNLLLSENIEKMDSFVALTGRDEDNLMAALLAKQNGVDKVIAKISRIDYIDIINTLDIDHIVSPKPITTKNILRYIKGLQKTMQLKERTLYKTIGHESAVFEFFVNDDFKYMDIPFANLSLEQDVFLAAIIRKKEIIIPDKKDCIKINDVVVVITNNVKVLDLNDIILGKQS